MPLDTLPNDILVNILQRCYKPCNGIQIKWSQKYDFTDIKIQIDDPTVCEYVVTHIHMVLSEMRYKSVQFALNSWSITLDGETDRKWFVNEMHKRMQVCNWVCNAEQHMVSFGVRLAHCIPCVCKSFRMLCVVDENATKL